MEIEKKMEEKGLNEKKTQEIDEERPDVCWACKGTGTNTIWLDHEETEVKCEACGGTGVFYP